MEPISPVVLGNKEFEVTYAEKQETYLPLPALRTAKAMLTRWRLTDAERKHLTEGGDLFICVLHFGQDLQPILPIAADAERALQIMVETESGV